MSVWELSHRWVGADPMVPKDSPIPMAVQPILRALSYAIATGELCATRPLAMSVEDAHPDDPDPPWTVEFGSRSGSLPGSRELYALLSCTPNRDVLDNLFVSIYEAFYWAVRRGEPLEVPDFLIPLHARVAGKPEAETGAANAQAPTNRRPVDELMDKAGAQGAALALWSEHPEMRIGQVCAHAVFLKAGGQNYGKVTRRRWAREVAPDAVKNRPGRPKTEK